MARASGNQIVTTDSGKAVVAKKVDRSEAMEVADMYLLKNLPRYLKRLNELAGGIRVVKEGKKGPIIYTEPPNYQALTYLIDRGLGKIPQRQEITGPEGGAVEVIPWLPTGMIPKEKDKEEEDIIEGEVTEVIDEE